MDLPRLVIGRIVLDGHVGGRRGLGLLRGPWTAGIAGINSSSQSQRRARSYLRGDWEAAEKLLTSVLAIEPRDPPALLLLCSVYRHLDQLDHATVLINEISRLEVADPWWVEVETERKRIRRAMTAEEESKNKTKSDARENPANHDAALSENAADMTADRAAAA